MNEDKKCLQLIYNIGEKGYTTLLLYILVMLCMVDFMFSIY